MAIRAVWAGMVISLPLLALVDTCLSNYFGSIGGSACDVYCGPGGLFGIYALWLLGLALWIGGMCLFVIEVVRTRGRGWWAWVALALEVASPVAWSLNVLG